MYLVYVLIILLVDLDVMAKPPVWNCVLYLQIDTTTLRESSMFPYV